MNATDETYYDSRHSILYCRGSWDVVHLTYLQQTLAHLAIKKAKKITIDGQAIEKMDSAGAWLLDKWQQIIGKQNIQSEFVGFSEPHQVLLNLVCKELKEKPPIPHQEKLSAVAHVGKASIDYLNQFLNYLAFIGKLAVEVQELLLKPTRLRWASFAAIIYRAGYQALPIIALLSFMIGVVLTYQMGLQLKNYGANIYIVNLLGLAVLREFAPLLTAIMVAGRSGSAFTAQLGMMKLNQEMDALSTMGITPGELLLLPRIFGLIIALPLVTMWADIFGIVGGMLMSSRTLNITWYDFLHRFPSVIPLRALLTGLGKTPVFAFIIATIGCYEGMNVQLNAESIGKNTTRSVVFSIFFIIVADALFSIVFSQLKL